MLMKSVKLWLCFILILGIAAVNHAPTASALAGFPTFNYGGVVLNPANLNYNPTGEIIFPSIIKASDHIANPLATYYMYYAPHDAPGGISMAYSNSINGPWTEYVANPRISNNWSPYYNVTHVSSPYMFWNDVENKYYMYYHGENTTMRIATSTDGINFTYNKVALTTSNFSGLTETSYAKVFEYTIPSKNNKYIMLLMGNQTNNTRHIYLAWSNDGLNWTTQQAPLISPNAAEGTNLSGPTFFPWNGKYYVAYHASSGNIHITEVGANFDLQNHLGVLYDSDAVFDRGRAASPNFITIGDTLYMFYEQGPRLGGQIAYARTVLNTPWNIFSDNMSNYASGWSTTGNGSFVQYNNDVNIIDTGTATGNYAYITKDNISTPSEAFTFEVRAKVNAAGTRNEITARNANYQIGLYLTYGTSGTAQNKASSPTKSFTLDTTVYHNYRVVVQSNYTYDLYVDGILRWNGATSLGSGTNIFKIGGDTPTTANMSIDQVYMGIGLLLPN
ncbi:MAG: hypothetical protein ACE3L7_12295 [Candidatus Pristimantibacillus sp.]